MFHRVIDAIRWTPLRMQRIAHHIYKGIKHFSKDEESEIQSDFEKLSSSGVVYWWLEFGVLMISLLGVAEIYETITDFIKFNTRSLTIWERKLLKGIYGNKINYKRVRIDNLALLGPKQFRMCYVSFYTINAWGAMSNHLLIHEMMHVWQYQKMGAVYIPRALAAQNSAMGYNYGGLSALEKAIENGQGFKAFNLEQQADIITDYYLLREGYKAQWSEASRFDLATYEYFIEKL